LGPAQWLDLIPSDGLISQTGARQLDVRRITAAAFIAGMPFADSNCVGFSGSAIRADRMSAGVAELQEVSHDIRERQFATRRGLEFRLGADRRNCQKLRLEIKKSHYPELRRLQCESTEGALTVKGRLSTYYLRQLAVCMAKQTAGNIPLQISIEVT
jgi:hypothetical protein